MDDSEHHLQLPHTTGCLVCGRDNPHGLRLDLFVDRKTGMVISRFVPKRLHVGFEGIVHGGILATVLDEAMTWASTWMIKRFCLCGEMTVRFRKSAAAEEPLQIDAMVTSVRSKLIESEASIRDSSGEIVSTATGKYIPISPEKHRHFTKTFVQDPLTQAAATLLIYSE